MQRINGPLLEYACNENNVDGFTTLRNARAQESGQLAAPNPMRRGDARQAIDERTQKGDTKEIGVDSNPA